MADKKYICIDSNLLSGRMFPEKSNAVEALRLAKSLNYEILVPRPVVIELENESKIKCQELLGRIEKLDAESKKYGFDLTFKAEAANDFVSVKFRKRLKDLFSSLGIVEIPFSSAKIEIEELFKSAVERRPPFDASGNSFRDAAIWLSVKEFFSKIEADEFLFVSEDNRYRSVAEKENSGIVATDLEGLSSHLEKHFEARVEKSVKKACLELKSILANKFSEIDDRIKKEVSFPKLPIQYPESLIRIRSFRSIEVGKVELAGLSDNNGEWVFDAFIIGELEVEVETSNAIKSARQGGLAAVLAEYSKKVGYEKAVNSSNESYDTSKFLEARKIETVIELKVQAEIGVEPLNPTIIRAASSEKSPWQFRSLKALRKLVDAMDEAENP